jgi:serine/threonine protein kinase
VATSSTRSNPGSPAASLLDGIRHFHSFGLAQNDVNPSNIMLDDEGRLVLIDFDSCRHVGESILETAAKRTPQWHDPAVEDSTEENDSAAFEELKTWVTESAESFRFR